jgi:hypothetical protein
MNIKMPKTIASNNYRPLFLLAMVLIVLESVLKGWFSFFVVPLLILVIPALLFPRFIARKQIQRRVIHPWAMPLIWVQLISTLLFYIMLPGFGDTQDILLFGFLVYNADSPMVTIVSWVAYFAFVIAVFASIAALVLLAIRKHHEPED